jgi:GntR family transcriptional repressor for pyruvate dehydrogenase complex
MTDTRLSAFRPVHTRKPSDEVLAVIADAIRGGLYRPGEVLPRQADLAAELQVSKHVVREAIEVLRRAGVVTVKRGNSGGTQVVSTNLQRVLAGLGGEVHANLLSLLEARRPLEIAAGSLAAKRADEQDLQRLHALADELEQLLERPDEFLQTDAMFHLAMVASARNPLLTEFHRRTIDQILSSTAIFPVGRIDPGDAIRHQRKTVAAIESRDPSRVRVVLDAHLGALEMAFLGEKLR